MAMHVFAVMCGATISLGDHEHSTGGRYCDSRRTPKITIFNEMSLPVTMKDL